MYRQLIVVGALLWPLAIAGDAYVRYPNSQVIAQRHNHLTGLAACFNGDKIFIFIDDTTYRWVKCVPQPIGQFRIKFK